MKVLHIIYFMFFSAIVLSQESLIVNINVENDTIGYHDVLKVNYEANNSDAIFKDPVFNDFEIYTPKNIHTEVTWSNNIKQSKIVITYFLKPTKLGDLNLEKGVFEYKDKTFETNSIIIQVKGENSENDFSKKENSPFVIAYISDYTPYNYQPVSVDYKLYYKKNYLISGVDLDFNNEYIDKFHMYSMDTDKTPTKEIINEQEYYCIFLKADIIRFTELYDTYINNKIVVNYRPKIYSQNSEFNFLLTQKIIPVISERIKTKKFVRDSKFPFEIKSFGNYKLEVIHPENIKVKKNKIIEITIQLYGDGYLEDELMPMLNISKAFEIISNTLKNETTIENEKTKTVAIRTYKIKPLLEGNFTFYPVNFHFYNESTNQKKTISSKEFRLSVK